MDHCKEQVFTFLKSVLKLSLGLKFIEILWIDQRLTCEWMNKRVFSSGDYKVYISKSASEDIN